MLAVADLLGVPESEPQRFREGFGLSASPGELGDTEGLGLKALDWLDDYATCIAIILGILYLILRPRDPSGRGRPPSPGEGASGAAG